MKTPPIHQDLARLLASRVIQPAACLSQLPPPYYSGETAPHDFLLLSARPDLLPDGQPWAVQLEAR